MEPSLYLPVVDAIERAPSVVVPLVREVPAAVLKRRPAPAKWSAHEHACHLAVMEPMWMERVELILRENHPTIISYEPEEDDPDRLLKMDLRSALANFERGRQALVGKLGTLRVEDWLRPAAHTAHARYSIFLMCRHIALHDGLHAYRIEESALGSHWPTER